MRIERYLPAISDAGIAACAMDHCALLLIDERLPGLRLARPEYGHGWHWQVRQGGRWIVAATWPAVGAAQMVAAYKGDGSLPGQGVQLTLDLQPEPTLRKP